MKNFIFEYIYRHKGISKVFRPIKQQHFVLRFIILKYIIHPHLKVHRMLMANLWNIKHALFKFTYVNHCQFINTRRNFKKTIQCWYLIKIYFQTTCDNTYFLSTLSTLYNWNKWQITCNGKYCIVSKAKYQNQISRWSNDI